MGENDFGLPQDVISAVCIAKYFGNVPPQPICEWSSGTKLPDNYNRLTETNLTVTLSIQLPATKEFNGDQFLCYVKKGADSSDKQTETVWMSPHLIINCKHCQVTKYESCFLAPLTCVVSNHNVLLL